jgi:hypothetical protein
MKKGAGLRTISPYRLWSLLPPLETSHLPDMLMFATAIALFYGVLMVGRTWLGPFTPAVEISQSPLALPAYAWRYISWRDRGSVDWCSLDYPRR